jgi:hypothetical protein
MIRTASPRRFSKIVMLLWLALYVLAATEVFCQQPKPDFTGMWKLNVKSSKQGVIHGSDVLEINHSGTLLKIQYRPSEDQTTRSYIIDGKERLASFATDGVTMAKTHWDGDTLVIESNHHDNNRGFAADTSLNFRYTLSADQKTLVVIVQGMRGPVSGSRAELIYERQATVVVPAK